MAKLCVGIDTSRGKEYIGTVSGPEIKLNLLYEKISDTLRENGRVGKAIHWQDFTQDMKKSSKREVIKTLKEFDSVNFNIFETDRARGCPKKEYFLRKVPNEISRVFEDWLKGRDDDVDIQVDNDFRVKNVKRGTWVFSRKLLEQLCYRMIGTHVKVRKNDVLLATVKHSNGNHMDLMAKCSNRFLSKEIELIDLVLGYFGYKDYKRDFEDVVYFHSI